MASSSKAVPASAAKGSETKPSAPPVAEAPAQEPSDFRCGIRGSPVLSSLGIGNLQIGRTVDIVKRTCRVTRDGDEMLEGDRERVLTVLLDQDPVRVTVTNGLIWRISVRSPRFETRDGLHVGTSLARLVARGDVHLFEGEDGLYVTLASHCGLSFRFSIPSREMPGKVWTVAHVVQRHGSTVADRVLITRCIE